MREQSCAELTEGFSAIGTKIDKFVLADSRALDWSSRRWRLLEEILRHQPDLVCLQEVDHFPFIEAALASTGYCGRSGVLRALSGLGTNLPSYFQILPEARLCLLLCTRQLWA